MKRVEPEETPNLGFQIAPMLDVVFVILLYFMVLAGTIKVEYEIKTTLPGSAEVATEPSDELPPDEVVIGITGEGQVTFNDDPIGETADIKLNDLYNEMRQVAETALQSKTKVIVTVAAEENVKYDRIMNVLDVLAKAKISNVTFSTTEGE